MEVYSIGFTQRRAQDFFGALKRAGIRQLLDVRINNSSQLAGFTKREDLPFFLRELCGVEYTHDRRLAPTQELLRAYQRKNISWPEYEVAFLALMVERQVERHIDQSFFTVPTVLLCSEAKPDRCHRRLILEYLNQKWGGLKIVHL